MKKMEEFFNLPPSVEAVAEEALPTNARQEFLEEAKEVFSSLTTAERVNFALPTVMGLDSHDSEMDDIAQKAVKTFDDLIVLGGNVPDLHAGKIYEVAGQLLKTALDAKNAKAEKKLRMVELQLKKVRSEQIDFENGNGKGLSPTGGEFDRNELLKFIVDAGKKDK